MSAVRLTPEQEQALAQVQTTKELAAYVDRVIFEEPLTRELVSLVLWTIVFSTIVLIGMALWPISVTMEIVAVFVAAALVQVAVRITLIRREERLRQAVENRWNERNALQGGGS